MGKFRVKEDGIPAFTAIYQEHNIIEIRIDPNRELGNEALKSAPGHILRKLYYQAHYLVGS
jgi:hypothetical protein